jgi:hypothetical protein
LVACEIQLCSNWEAPKVKGPQHILQGMGVRVKVRTYVRIEYLDIQSPLAYCHRGDLIEGCKARLVRDGHFDGIELS